VTERLSLRLTPEQDAVLRRAADARGESANDFVLRHAVEAAEIELADRRVFAVDEAEWDQLQELLSAPLDLPAAVVKLLSNPSLLEQSAKWPTSVRSCWPATISSMGSTAASRLSISG
jgi:uncharacterized protein (DUF1778 family)